LTVSPTPNGVMQDFRDRVFHLTRRYRASRTPYIGHIQSCLAVVKMTNSGSGALFLMNMAPAPAPELFVFMNVAPVPELSFHMAPAPAATSVRLHTLKMSIVLVCLKLNGK